MDWQPVSVEPEKATAALLIFPPSDQDVEFFGGRYTIGDFEPCPDPDGCGCFGGWDWDWEERGREPGPTHWMPLPEPPAITAGTRSAET